MADSIGKIILKNSVMKCKAKILVRTAKDKAKDKEKGGKNAVKSAAEKKNGEIKGKDGE